jgi:CRISPR-associated endonuclease/helicase Cas3
LKAGERPCRLIATSLIEAGVDLDFPRAGGPRRGWIPVVQAAGRVNRDGKRPVADSTLTIFSAPGRSSPAEVRSLAEAMHRTADRFGDDLLAPAAIRDWFEHVYWRAGPERLGQPMVAWLCLAETAPTFRSARTAAAFRMIESTMVPVIIPRDEKAARAGSA